MGTCITGLAIKSFVSTSPATYKYKTNWATNVPPVLTASKGTDQTQMNDPGPGGTVVVRSLSSGPVAVDPVSAFGLGAGFRLLLSRRRT